MRIFLPIFALALLSGCQDSRVTDLAAENKALEKEQAVLEKKLGVAVAKVEEFENLLTEFEKQRSAELEKQLTENVETAKALTTELEKQVESGKTMLASAEQASNEIAELRKTIEENVKISEDDNALVGVARTVEHIEKFLQLVRVYSPNVVPSGQTRSLGYSKFDPDK